MNIHSIAITQKPIVPMAIMDDMVNSFRFVPPLRDPQGDCETVEFQMPFITRKYNFPYHVLSHRSRSKTTPDVSIQTWNGLVSRQTEDSILIFL